MVGSEKTVEPSVLGGRRAKWQGKFRIDKKPAISYVHRTHPGNSAGMLQNQNKTKR
jgi:hypothetical protein